MTVFFGLLFGRIKTLSLRENIVVNLESVWLELAQRLYGKDRLGWDEVCDGPSPHDWRSRGAGWMLGKKNF
jgi:hypothetical protein